MTKKQSNSRIHLRRRRPEAVPLEEKEKKIGQDQKILTKHRSPRPVLALEEEAGLAGGQARPTGEVFAPEDKAEMLTPKEEGRPKGLAPKKAGRT